MKEKGILKFRSEESKGAMHYIEYNGKTVSLTRKDSKKVEHIKKTGTLKIAKNLLSKNFEEVKIVINDTELYVIDVFEYMKQRNHTHYKKDYKDLVVLQYV